MPESIHRHDLKQPLEKDVKKIKIEQFKCTIEPYHKKLFNEVARCADGFFARLAKEREQYVLAEWLHKFSLQTPEQILHDLVIEHTQAENLRKENAELKKELELLNKIRELIGGDEE